LAERLRQAVHSAGGNNHVASEARVPLSTLNTWLAAKADPKITKLARIARVCRVTLDYLAGAARLEASPVSRIDENFAVIPRLDVRASAGDGALPVPLNEDDEFLAFRSDWLRRQGVDPAKAELMTALGDSMEPTISDGDLMIVDRSFERIVSTGIYVIVLERMVHVRRAQIPMNGKLLLTPDNPRYQATTIDMQREQLIVLGLVRWVFGRP
jgi:phage repressor protein C with HTH and peptisase S24 domain